MREDTLALGPVRLECVSLPGGPVNRDRAGWTERAAWVLDGATPLVPPPVVDDNSFPARVSAAIAALVGDDTLSLRHVVAAVARRAAVAAPAADRSAEPSCTVALVRWDRSRLEYLLLGDVALVVGGDGRSLVRSDERVAELDRRAVEEIAALQRQGLSFAAARERVMPLLREHRRRMNTPGGYWVLSRDPAAADHALTGELPLDRATRVLLMTDGFARCVTTFRLYASWDELLAAVAANGVSAVAAGLRAAEAADHELCTYPRLSPSDDATALYLELAAAR